MSSTDPEVYVTEARETLERLYDDPDAQIKNLVEASANETAVEGAFDVFQALANKDRLRLLEALREGERCGCELMVILNSPQSTVSSHLQKLREAGLVKNRKKGKWNYYRISDPAVAEVIDLSIAIQD